MSFQKIGLLFLFALPIHFFGQESKIHVDAIGNSEMMVRMAELEIDPASLDAYLNILKEEAEASVRLEPGVICIYPMYQKENPTQIRLLEIYANTLAYETHIQTPHFKKYKTSTSKMVKTLKLIEMEAIDMKTMSMIFKKLKN